MICHRDNDVRQMALIRPLGRRCIERTDEQQLSVFHVCDNFNKHKNTHTHKTHIKQ